MPRKSETTTSPTASKTKPKRSEEADAPKTLKVLTVRMRTGTSAKKKFTKLMKASTITSRAMPSSVQVVASDPWAHGTRASVSK